MNPLAIRCRIDTLTNVSANSESQIIRLPYGGFYVSTVVATSFGGGTVKVQTLGVDGVTWIDVVSQTSNSQSAFRAPAGATIKQTLTGATSPVGVYAAIEYSSR